MLRELRITGLGVIRDLDLELHPGLNVLTGETGAGKTMVTVGLSLALGGRASASLVREGASASRIQARFDAPAGAEDWAEDGEVILARSVTMDGKSSARIGGQLATASALAALGEVLVEVHGQHHAQRLLSPATQTSFLDRSAGPPHAVALVAYREAFEAWRAVRGELDDLRNAMRDRARELDLLAYQVHEIEVVSPGPSESEDLAAEEGRLAHVERLLEAAAIAEDSLAADGAAADSAGRAANTLEAASAFDPAVRELAVRASGLGAELAELARDVRAYRESLVPIRLGSSSSANAPAALKSLQRKYGETDVEVLEFLAQASQRLAGLHGADERLDDLQVREAGLGQEAVRRAAKLTAGRAKASVRLAAAIDAELEQLGMPGARMEIVLEAAPRADPRRCRAGGAATGTGTGPARCSPSRRRRRGASCPGRCSHAAAFSPTSTRCRRLSSTRSTRGSEVRRGSRWDGGSRASPRAARSSS